MTSHTFDDLRSYLVVASDDSVGAAAAVWAWTDGPPDLCITSPSAAAEDTAVFACAGRYVRIVEEPLLAARGANETPDDFADRFAQALRAVLVYDASAALVVCDEVPADWPLPLRADDTTLMHRSDRLEAELPLP